MSTSHWADRGKRLQQMRHILDLSRLKFCERFGFANTTVAQWETLSGASPGITERHARRLICAVEKAGLIVSEEWLLYGTGDPPYLLKPTIKPPTNLFHFACSEDQLQTMIHSNLQLLGPGYQGFSIPDDTMQPRFNRDDYVISLIAEKSQWRELFDNKACLITLKDGSQLVRIFREYQPERYVLLNTNPQAKYSQQIVFDPKISSISQIVIHYQWCQVY